MSLCYDINSCHLNSSQFPFERGIKMSGGGSETWGMGTAVPLYSRRMGSRGYAEPGAKDPVREHGAGVIMRVLRI